MHYAAKGICTKVANPTKWSWKRLKRAARHVKEAEKVTWAMRPWKNDETKVDVHGLGLGARPREEVNEWWHDDVQRHSGDTLVENTSETCAEHGGSCSVVTRAVGDLGMQSMMADCGLSGQVRVWTDSNAAKATASRRGVGKTQTFGIEILAAAGGDQIGKSDHEEGPSKATFGEAFDEGKIVARDRWFNQRSQRAHARASRGNQGNEPC